MSNLQELKRSVLNLPPEQAAELLDFIKQNLPKLFYNSMTEGERKKLSLQFDAWTRESGDKIATALGKICDASTFLDFILLLADDWEEDIKRGVGNPFAPEVSPNGWENGFPGSFLEAAHAAAAANNLPQSELIDNPWRAAATILACGKSYE